MENKGKTRRLKKGILAAFMLPFVTAGATVVATQTENEDACEISHDVKLYGDGTPRDPYPYTGYAAEACDYYEQPDFVLEYFRNLTEHFPTNNCGNCGYTAATMLLSYYDTYWNGDIINDKFNSDPAMIGTLWNRDYSSPGVNDYAAHIDEIDEKRKPKEGATPEEIEEYNIYLCEYIYGPYLRDMTQPVHLMYNFVSYLYHIALGYNGPNGSNGQGTVIWHFGPKEPTTGLNGDSLRNLMNLYFTEKGLSDVVEAKTLDFNQMINYSTERERRIALREEAIRRLNEGQPIIYMGDLPTKDGHYNDEMAYEGGNGHIAVAYAYDKGCDQIIGHLGWKGEKYEYSMASFDKAFADFDAFLYLDVKQGLEFTPGNGRFFANNTHRNACDLASHWHADDGHRAKIAYGDPEFHALQCICGDVRYESHSHEMVPFDEENHALKCACGDVIYEQHNMTSTPHGCFYHVNECPCGYVEDETHHFRLGGMLTFVCRDCGYTMPAGQLPNMIYNP